MQPTSNHLDGLDSPLRRPGLLMSENDVVASATNSTQATLVFMKYPRALFKIPKAPREKDFSRSRHHQT